LEEELLIQYNMPKKYTREWFVEKGRKGGKKGGATNKAKPDYFKKLSEARWGKKKKMENEDPRERDSSPDEEEVELDISSEELED